METNEFAYRVEGEPFYGLGDGSFIVNIRNDLVRSFRDRLFPVSAIDQPDFPMQFFNQSFEKNALAEAMRIYRESAPIRQSEIEQYKGILYHGVPVSAILQAWSICQIQPDPGFSDDNNYLKNAIAEAEHVDFHNGLSSQTVIAPDGTDITETVEKAVAWLTEHSF